MSSPFTEVPKSDWITSNDHAFGIFDKYPVTEGHALVIPQREVPTWFDASPEEQRAIMDLVDDVKAILDERFQPDGYNIGINAGEAAGQTVMHLHVHVIPRYDGDMDDPRGGVRHVIPEEGNYLVDSDTTDAEQSQVNLSVGGRDDSFIDHVRPLLGRADRIAVVAAFIQDSGLELLRAPVLSSLDRGADVQILTGDYFAITQVEALRRLLDWQDSAEIDTESGTLRVRVVEVGKNDGWPKSFHPKSWRFETDDLGVAYVGSSNISRLALTDGTEWNLRIDRRDNPETYREITEAFEHQWMRARRLTPNWIEKYEIRVDLQSRPLPPGEEDPEPPAPDPEPHELQREALERLDRARKDGRRRALIVHATGLGKTWLAAFDVRQFSRHGGDEPRVLFVAHRTEILQQAADTFRNILSSGPEEPRRNLRFGWFIGQRNDLDGDVVFASVQKLRQQHHLEDLDEDAFDYIVIDEVHHAAAPSYRRILQHLEPEFLLGMTATPDRADEADIRPLFDDFVAHRAPIGDGIELGYLCPFRYHGLRDVTDYVPIPWRSGRFQTEQLTNALATHRRMKQVWEALQKHPADRTLIFCCSIDHAQFVRDWLDERGLDVAAIYSKPDSDDRDASLRALAAGRIDAVCAVDILNEGVDIPRIDRVVMLRPTESPVVFMQQLGRGLRQADGKDHLLVLDFVGNHRVFLDRVRTLLSLGDEPTSLREFLVKGEQPELPPGCHIDIELEAVELLRDLLPKSSRSALVREYRELVATRDRRPTATEIHRLGFNLRNLKRYGGWFGFLADEGDLTDAEQRAWQSGEAWFHELETTRLNKCYKAVVIQTLLDADALDTGLPVDELADRSHRILTRSPELFDDLVGIEKLPNPRHPEPDTWRKYWDNWPLKVWAGDKGRDLEAPWFQRVSTDDGLLFDSRIPVPNAGDVREAFIEMTRELVEYRLAKYRDRFDRTESGVGAFAAAVYFTEQNAPAIELPSRDAHPDIPEGETTVILPDGQKWRFRFTKSSVKIARPVGTRDNRLPDLLRMWFGPAAGEPETDFEVEFRPTTDGWQIEPRGEKVIPFPRPGHVIAFPSVEAAAGAHQNGRIEQPAWKQLRTTTGELPDAHFAVRVHGDSMDGGDDRIRDRDWALMKWAHGEPFSRIEDRIALIRHTPDGDSPPNYHLKRVARTDDGYELRSDNPNAGPIPATDDMTVVALLVHTLRAAQVLTPAQTRLIDAIRRELVRRDDINPYAEGFKREISQLIDLWRREGAFAELFHDEFSINASPEIVDLLQRALASESTFAR